MLADGIESGLLNEGQAMAILVVLVSAGSETTSSLLATAVETLARNHELQQQLRREPDGIPAAVEDFLRENGPFQFHYRWTTTDTTLGGTKIPVGSMVLLSWAAANRPDPDPGAATSETSAAEPTWLPPRTMHSVGGCTSASARRLLAWKLASRSNGS